MLLRKWLLFRFVFLCDLRAFRRLKALSRLDARKELNQLKEAVEAAGRLGLDPSLIVDAYRHEKLRALKEYVPPLQAARRGHEMARIYDASNVPQQPSAPRDEFIHGSGVYVCLHEDGISFRLGSDGPTIDFADAAKRLHERCDYYRALITSCDGGGVS